MKITRRNILQHLIMTLALLILCLILPQADKPINKFRLAWLSRGVTIPTDTNLFWIGFDPNSLNKLGNWPLTLDSVSPTLNFLKKSGAKTVAIDIPEHLLTTDLIKELDNNPMVVRRKEKTAIPRGAMIYPNNGFAIEAASKLKDKKIEELSLPDPLWIYYLPNPMEPMLGATGARFLEYAKIHMHDPKAHNQFRNKTILILPFTVEEGELTKTPISKNMPNGLITLNVLNMIYTNKTIRSINWIEMTLLWIFIFLLPLLTKPLRRRTIVLVYCSLAVMFIPLTFLLLIIFQIMVPATWPFLAFIAAAARTLLIR